MTGARRFSPRRTAPALALALTLTLMLFGGAGAPGAARAAEEGDGGVQVDCNTPEDCTRMHGRAPGGTQWACESGTCVMRDAPDPSEAQPPPPPAPPPPKAKPGNKKGKREPKPNQKP